MADRPAVQHEPFWLLPECVPSYRAWLDVRTQWVHGFDGPVGLSYQGVEAWARITGLRGRVLRERFEDLRVMERAYLDAAAELRAERQARGQK